MSHGIANGTGIGDVEATARAGAIAAGHLQAPVVDEQHRFTGEGVRGLSFERRWTRPGVHPYDEITWELRTANISNESGKTVFEQTDIEVPTFWSQLATNVVVSKYFRGHIGTPQRERSVKQLIDRVVNTIAAWAHTQHYFASDADLQTFKAELTHLLVHQKMAFNSPVWFNVGVEERPQCSACFINSVQDSMSSIMDLAKTEAMLFKYGSGAGVNLSPIRGSKEKMSGGGIASGPVSFMKGFDAFAGVVKCLVGSTHVVTTDGLLRIEEAIPTAGPEGFEESDLVTLNTPAGPTTISQIYRSPLAPVRRMELRSGLTLTGTREHPVLTLSKDFRLEWVALSDVRPGTRVAVERNRQLWPTHAPSLAEFRETYKNQKRTLRYPTEVTPELARLLGYLVAEGAIDHERFRFSSADPEVMADYCRCVEAVFGIDPSAQVTDRTNPKTGVVTQQLALYWVGALQFLEYCGLPASLSDRKAVPAAIRRSPRSLVLEFLGAYTEGDGHVGTRSVQYASASEWLVEELQLLALNMGVVGRRAVVNGYQHLNFMGEEATRLARLLRPYLVTPRKRSAAVDLMSKTAKGHNTNLDVIPGLVSALRSLFDNKNGWAQATTGAMVRTRFGVFNRVGDNVSYSRVREVVDLVDQVRQISPGMGSTLAAVLDDQYLWDEVKSIRDDGSAYTYDFTVPEVHAFISNGVVSHNSGGKTRRAAKMVILDADHPDVLDFIDSKANEEKKAWALIEAGYDGSFTGEAYGSIFFQNANHSVRVTDDFMRAVEADSPWTTHEVNTGDPAETMPARTIFRRMAEAAWICGDPGIQYDTTINDWHTSANTDRIYASNPCCFVGQTLVDTVDGFMRFDDLERIDRSGGTLPLTYSFDRSTGRTVAQQINKVWVAGYAQQIVEVRTELGRVLRCTPEHRWLTFDGRYVEAQDLEPGTRLRKVYREQVATAATVAVTNDRVVSVQRIELAEAIPVFDMEVEGTHNFGVSDVDDRTVRSVVVSNSEYMFLNDTACFAPETRISTPLGLRTVVELFAAQERGERVTITTDLVSEHDHRRMTAHRPALITDIGERPVYRMRLADGREIRATGDHRFLTAGGEWKELQHLEVGVDRIAIRESGNPVEFASSDADVRRWRMLGWMTGDGVFSKDTAALVFGPDERATADWMEQEFQALVAEARGRSAAVDAIEFDLTRGALLDEAGIHMPSTSRTSHVSTAANGVMQISTGSDAVIRMLEDQYGYRQAVATGKDVPTEVHRVVDDLKVAYLQGLFSADGTIRRAATEDEVMLASSAPALLRSVQLLLADLGMTSRITWTHPTGRKNPQGQLHLYNQQARAFLATVGFPCSERKQARTAAILDRPFEGRHRNPRSPRVVSIEPAGVETVYDITEPFTPSVIAEGMVAHNCNLASLNLMRFVGDDGEFDVDAFRFACKVTITAQEILVDNASYPTPEIEENSHRYRPLGIGYANLGALLMSRGLAYDSDEGRGYAAAITAIMTGESYRQSAAVARDHGGPFFDYAQNESSFLRVMRKHRDAAYALDTNSTPADMVRAARHTWDDALSIGELHGYRNAQSSVLAPTGTIAFYMDCDTTGIEPDIALIKYKKLVGEGFLKIVNQTVPAALRKLGYTPDQVEEIIRFIDERETIEGAPGLRPEHLPVFDCAFKPVNGERSIQYMGHVRMMGAVQPFLSGAISKTVNMPEAATAEDIEDVYLQGWKLGLKAIAIYRDGSKRSQPLSTGKKKDADAAAVVEAALPVEPKPYRRRLPDERRAVTHKFQVAGHEGYITVGLYPDGQPGEIFLKMAKEGSTVSGLMDSLATMTSLALQYGVPLRDLTNKFAHVRFEPAGFTGNGEIPIAKSIVDYVFRWMGSRFLPRDQREALGLIGGGDTGDGSSDPVPATSGAISFASAAFSTAPAPLASPAAGPAVAPSAPAPGAVASSSGGSSPSAASPAPAPATSAQPWVTATTSDPTAIAAAVTPIAERVALPVYGTNGNGHTNGNGKATATAVMPSLGLNTKVAFSVSADSPSCAECGSIMVRNGSCYKCLNCGSTSGCS